MSFKKRVLRLALIVLFVLAFIGYFSFSTFLFSPLEGDFEADVSALVSQDVDFFLAKARLEQDFDEFPVLADWPRIEATQAWRAYEQTGLRELDAEYGVRASWDELRGLREQLGGFAPLGLIGGRDIALAGTFNGPHLKDTNWIALGRVGFVGKLAVSLLSFPGLIGLEERGFTAAVEEHWVTISGGELPREIHVARVKDVVIFGPSLELVQAALDLDARNGQGSLGLRAYYNDHIANSPRNPLRDELEFYVDFRAYSEAQKRSLRWPDVESQDFGPALAGRLFQLGLLKSIAGTIGFDNGLQVHAHADLSSELMSSLQKRVYDERGFDQARLKQVARVAAQDAGLFVYAHIDPEDWLNAALESAEPALRQNLEDTLQSTGEFSDLSAFVKRMDALFRNRVALVMRANDYPSDPESDPPNDGRDVPAWAVVLWTDGSQETAQAIKDLHQLVVTHQGKFGLAGRNPGDKGVYTNKVAGGFTVWEFWHPLMPGTGHVSTCQTDDLYVISNSFRMVGDILPTYFGTEDQYPSLTGRGEFTALLGASLPGASAAIWFDPRQLGKLRRDIAQFEAKAAVLGAIDWKTERARVEDQVLREHFPGKVRGQLDETTQLEVDKRVGPLLSDLEAKMMAEQVPAKRAETERGILYSELVRAGLLMLSLDRKQIEMSLRAIVPLDG